MGVREKKEYKKRHTESMKKHGRNKKVLQPPVQQVPLTSMPFSNRQTLGKVRRRVLEALLKSPRKKTYIMTALSKDTCTVVQSAQIQHQNEIHQKVIDFYCDDRISCMTPGVKDYIIVREGCQKHSVQKMLVGWLVVFNVPSTARSFRDGTPIYCPLRRT